jgi:serine/threonine protein kinase/DNA-binding SARP family transcriptional activator/WD40 repeat protein
LAEIVARETTKPFASLEIGVLGPLIARAGQGDSDLLSVGGPQQRKVLAALVASPEEVLSYERLISVLWPDGDEPDNARRSAISYVARLRSVLGEGLIATTDVGYILVAGTYTVDADRFSLMIDRARTLPSASAVEVLDAALNLWRGPVFGDLHDEWWVRSFVNRFEELRLTALADRIDALSSDGWNVRALTEATSLAERFPLREQFIERGMLGLQSLGQTPEGLRLFQRYRTLLAEETGLQPSTGLVLLERSLIEGDDANSHRGAMSHPLRGYVLTELIGEGSFGSVYRARHPALAREVAIKIVRAELADDRGFVERFEAEAQLVARLEHPHIVPLYDFWRQPGGAYLVFRLLRGANAEDRLRRDGPFTVEAATRVLMEIGSALGTAHGCGVVHRDVKPANILFDDQGAAYLIDFGIAALSDDTSGSSASRVDRWSAGSLAYASPEQIRDGAEDAKADQYALASTLWELLTGRTPFASESQRSVIEAKLRGPLPSLRTIRGDLPAKLAEVLSAAGALHPADRFPSISDFMMAWAAALTSDTLTATSPTSLIQPISVSDTAPDPYRVVVNPYKGLRPFVEADAEDFCGRDTVLQRLAEAVERNALTAVIGPSGSGKSSLVLAGLVPLLRRSATLVAVMTPGEDPFASLSSALSHVATERARSLISIEALRLPDGIRTAMEAIVFPVNGARRQVSFGARSIDSQRLVVVVDQFEELWTHTARESCQRFLEELSISFGSERIRVVTALRADFLDRPLADPVLGPLMVDHSVLVTPMAATELHEAITFPAERIGVRVEAQLVSRVVAEMISQPGSLPLLSFTLAELFEKRSGATISLEDYMRIGGLAGSLSRQADQLTDEVSGGDSDVVRRMFTRLVSTGDGDSDIRRCVPRREMAGVPAAVIDAFVNRRLLTLDRDDVTREPTIEVAHDALLKSWDQLRSWLNDEREWRRELRSLTSAASAWCAQGRSDDDLYRGPRLAIVEELASTQLDSLTDEESEFLSTSLLRQSFLAEESRRSMRLQRQQNVRLRRSLVGIGVLLAVALIAGSSALWQTATAHRERQSAEEQRNSATKAEKQSRISTLAARSLAARATERDVAALLAVEAYRRSPNTESRSALIGTFTFDPGFLGFRKVPGLGSTVGVGIPGGSDALMTGYPIAGKRGAKPWGPPVRIDTITGKVKFRLASVSNDPLQTMTVAVSTNGRYGVQHVVIDKSNITRSAVFDLVDNKRVGPNIDARITGRAGLAVNDAGTLLVVTSASDATALVFDARTGVRLALIPGPVEAPISVASVAAGFGPDGLLYLGSTGKTLRALDPKTFRVLRTIAVPDHATGELQFSRDGSFFVTRGIFNDPSTNLQRGVIALVDAKSGVPKWQLSGDRYRYGECAHFVFSEAHDRLWCGDYFGQITERALATGERMARVRQSQEGWVGRMTIANSPSGSVLVAFGENTGQFTRWSIDGAGPIQRVVARGRGLTGFVASNLLLVTTPNGRVAPFDLDPQLWNPFDDTMVPGVPKFTFAVVAGGVISGILPDGRAGTFDPQTGRLVVFESDPNPFPTAFAMAQDKSIAAAGFSLGPKSGRVILIDANSGAQLREINVEGPVGSLAFSPDHSRLYVIDRGLSLFDTTNGARMAVNDNHDLGLVTAGPTGLVAASGVGGNIMLLDPRTLAVLKDLSGARGLSNFLKFDDAGRTLLSRGSDNTVSLIDVKTGQRLGDELVVDGRVALSNDGQILAVSNGLQGGVSLWDLRPERLAAAACELAGRNLTRNEWNSYLQELGPYRATCPQNVVGQ